MDMERKTHFNFWYFVIAVFAIMPLQQRPFESRQVETLPYCEFRAMVREGRVGEVSVADETLRGRHYEPLPDGRTRIFALGVDPELAQILPAIGPEPDDAQAAEQPRAHRPPAIRVTMDAALPARAG